VKRSQWRACLPGTLHDPVLRSWLTEPDSLTARCQSLCTVFRVRLLHYGKGRPLADEASACRNGRQPAWVREVVLECDGRPVIFAHTTVSTAANGRLSRWMAGLGNRSLGSLLFSYPGFRRGAIEFLRLDGRHPLYQRAAAICEVSGKLWARRSSHQLGCQRVLVTEVFLPEITRLDKPASARDPAIPLEHRSLSGAGASNLLNSTARMYASAPGKDGIQSGIVETAGFGQAACQ
jgi:chorismate--pyruvate lyase